MRPVNLENMASALDVICPMHLILSPNGNVINAGPTLQRLVDGLEPGASFKNHFSVSKPCEIQSANEISKILGQKLSIEVISSKDFKLSAIAMTIGEYFLLNLSLSLSVVEDVRRFELTTADFAPTDLAIGMIYLSEARSIAVAEYKSLSERLKGEKSRAEIEANTDALTGLFNLRALRQELELLHETEGNFAIMTLDLDHFKAVNDNLGHAAGDHVLRETASILLSETRDGDVVARNGGDEFTVLLKGIKEEQDVLDVASRIILRFEQPMSFNGATCHVSASIGTIFSKGHKRLNNDSLLASADQALYRSKRAGRAQNTVYTPSIC